MRVIFVCEIAWKCKSKILLHTEQLVCSANYICGATWMIAVPHLEFDLAESISLMWQGFYFPPWQLSAVWLVDDATSNDPANWTISLFISSLMQLLQAFGSSTPVTHATLRRSATRRGCTPSGRGRDFGADLSGLGASTATGEALGVYWLLTASIISARLLIAGVIIGLLMAAAGIFAQDWRDKMSGIEWY